MTFDSAVARISCAQICRANGIDRCSPVALESLSDIMTRFLDLLATTAMQAAYVKSNELCDLEDAVFALENLHIIPSHIDGADSEGLQEFVAWLRGPATQRALHVSKMQQQTLSALGQAQGAAIAAQQGANEMQGSSAKVDDHADWLRQMVNKQVLMGHGQKYKSTVFGDGHENDFRIAGAEFMDEEMAKKLGVPLVTPEPEVPDDVEMEEAAEVDGELASADTTESKTELATEVAEPAAVEAPEAAKTSPAESQTATEAPQPETTDG